MFGTGKTGSDSSELGSRGIGRSVVINIVSVMSEWNLPLQAKQLTCKVFRKMLTKGSLKKNNRNNYFLRMVYQLH